MAEPEAPTISEEMLLAALKAYKDCSDAIRIYDDDPITVGDLRRARAALKEGAPTSSEPQAPQTD